MSTIESAPVVAWATSAANEPSACAKTATRAPGGAWPVNVGCRTSVIPSLFDVPRYASLPEGEERWMLETALVRGRNRVCDALSDCRSLIDDTLAKLR